MEDDLMNVEDVFVWAESSEEIYEEGWWGNKDADEQQYRGMVTVPYA